MASEILTGVRMYANGEMFAIVDGTTDETKQMAQQFKNAYVNDVIKVSHSKMNFSLTKVTTTKGAGPQRHAQSQPPTPVRRPNIARRSH